jgi:hypothetical protein
MARTRVLLTAEVGRQVVAFVRAGAYPHVAAEAAGIDRDVFEGWLRRGAASAAEPYRSFRRDVRQAHAQARVRAEVAVLQDRPFEWLRAGPGKDDPGWTSPARARPADGPGRDLLADAKYQALVRVLLDATTPFPDVRSRLSQELEHNPRRR